MHHFAPEILLIAILGAAILSVFAYGTVLWIWFTFRPEEKIRLFEKS